MSSNKTPVVFTGRTSEYFGIWIVNLLLSIITFGIYSAWAKVRRKKYFYNNTLIDGVGFDYHANPIAILKGRIIAFVLFVVYQVLAGFNPILAVILFIIFMIALPWIVCRGLLFNARNSSHRGLRFDFDGKYGEAALVFIGYTLLTVVTLGLAIPFVAQRTQKFIIDHHKFGLSHFKMEALVKDFYKIYLVIFLIPLIGIIAAIAIPQYAKYKEKASQAAAHQTQQTTIEPSFGMQADMNVGGFIKVANTDAIEVPADQNTMTEAELAEENAALAIEQEESAQYESADAAQENMSDEEILKDLSPEERAEYDRLMKAFEGEAANSETDVTTPKKDPLKYAFGGIADKWGTAAAIVLGLLGLLLYLAVIFSFAAYFKSRIQNLVFNNTTLDHIGFFSNQRMRDLVWLYVTNALALMFTFGFATPWAQIRMAKYRADHLSLTGETDWDKFVGEKKESSKAMGEEIADMFDVDLSFG